MTFSDPLLLAVVFLAAGLSLGLAAYAVWIRRSEEAGEDELEEETETPIPVSEDVPPLPATPAETEAAEMRTETAEPEGLPIPEKTVPVATILRQEGSGALVVRIGAREYHSAAGLQGTEAWTQLKDSTAELVRWFSESGDRDLAQPMSRELEADGMARPQSMVDQINAILKTRSARKGRKLQSVYLVENPEGEVRVMVGLDSYLLDEVPDAKIRHLIQEAVQEWEALQ